MKKLIMAFVCVPLLVACNSQVADKTYDADPAADNAVVAGESLRSGVKATETSEMSALDMFTSVQGEYDAKMEEYQAAIAAAKPSERRKLYGEKFPQPRDYADRFMEIAEKHPEDGVAAQALAWVAVRVRRGEVAQQATETLFENHSDSEHLAPLCFALVSSPNSTAQERLEMLVEKSPHDVVKGAATLCLANRLKNMAERDDSIEEADYLPLFKSVVNDFADVELNGRKFADAAANVIFEIENLSIGSEAPDIQAEDLDGVAFKLSDYRGKVVVLDFWGHW